jgi:septal ring factor EnvC (AmiA/AmiB activator)
MSTKQDAVRRALIWGTLAPLVSVWLGAPLETRAAPAAAGASDDVSIAEVLSAIETAEARKARAEAEIVSLRKRQAAAKRRMQARTRSLYRISRAGLLPLAGGFPALLSHFGRVERLERLVKEDLAALEDLRRRGEALREEAAKQATAIDTSRQRLFALRREKERRLETRRLEARFQSTFERSSFADAAGGRERAFADGLRVVGGGAASFADQHGTLAVPLAGAFEARERTREGGPGLELRAEPGTSVRAAAEGRVAFADRYEPYGRLVIVDHGDDYYTVYGGLGRIGAQLGDFIGRGARIGTVGADRDPPALYFEVRRGTESLPPRPWLGL